MSLPQLIVKVAIAGGQAVGKAFYAAGQQAVKNAKYKPQGAVGGEAAGVSNAQSGSATDRLTREQKMTLDEAQLILNVKRDSPMEDVLKHYEHLFKANSPPAPPAADANAAPKGRSARAAPVHSHYLQSKVVRALERLKAEAKAAEEPAEPLDAAATKASDAGAAAPPPQGGQGQAP